MGFKLKNHASEAVPEPLRHKVYIYGVYADCTLIYRGYYMAARRYDFYLQVKTIFYKRAKRVSKILFLTREDKSHIFKPPCNVLFII
jgi:hypothetical protein